MQFPTSIDLSRSLTELGMQGGWMEIYFHHTFPPLAGMVNRANDKMRDDQTSEDGARATRPSLERLSPTQVRLYASQAGAV